MRFSNSEVLRRQVEAARARLQFAGRRELFSELRDEYKLKESEEDEEKAEEREAELDLQEKDSAGSRTQGEAMAAL